MSPPDISPEEIRRALAVVTNSQVLRSARSRALLAFLVEETIAGRGDRLKAYSIATLLLDRDSSFDPQGDSIVRVEASKLRRALEIYYETEGANDDIVIILPRGAYQTQFVRRSARGTEPDAALPTAPVNADVGEAPEVSPPGRRRLASLVVGGLVTALLIVFGVMWLHHRSLQEPPGVLKAAPLSPAIVLGSFAAMAGDDLQARRVSEFRVDLSNALSRFGRFRLREAENAADQAGPAYVVTAQQTSPGALMVTARHRPSGDTIWSAEVSLDADRSEAISSVVTPLASPYGAIFSHERGALAGAPDANPEACLIHTLDSLRRSDPDQYPLCLDAASTTQANSMIVWSVLGRVYRGRYLNHGRDGDLMRAREATQRGVELASLNERARLADLEVRFLTDPTAVNEASIESIISVNRRQADTLARLGRLAISAGLYDRGEALILEGGKYLPLAPIDWGMLFVADLMRGRHGRESAWSTQLAAGNNAMATLLAICAAVEAGDDASAAAARDFERLHPQIARAPDAFMKRWGFVQPIRAMVLSRLQSVGIPSTAPR